MPKGIKGLYAIIDTSFSPQYTHVELAHMALLGGCRLIQLRIKGEGGLWQRTVFDIAKKITALKQKFDFTFIINDCVDVAGEIKADGIHIGANDPKISEVRRHLPNAIIGYSSHSLEEAVMAEQAGADYIAFGAIFSTITKGLNHPVQGTDKLKEVTSTIKKPVVAIGGIKRTNVGDIIAAGASSVAMITGLTMAKDVVAETRWYVEKLCRQF